MYILASRTRLRTNCDLFLQSHFLTTHAVRLVPHKIQFDLQYIVLPNETGQCATQYVIQRDDKDTPETLTISDSPIAAQQFGLCYEDINEEELLGYLPQGVSGKLLSVTLFRGKRTFTFFLTDEVPTLTLIFQNEFNVSDTLYLTAQTKRKVSFDRRFAYVVDNLLHTMIIRRLNMRARRPRFPIPSPVILRRLCCLTNST